ncbi:MAG: hypothetical protein GX856_00460 [Gammaproteobacteria bacterium]|nr:hypothetical protein [Gammaproteobacteria bacterium]
MKRPVRQTACGLRADYDPVARVWRYYRWSVSESRYVLTGTTRRFQP